MSGIRLSKVLKDLNISLDRAVEYLHSQNVGIEKNPNVKLDQKAYQLLVTEFSEDKMKKDASLDVVINKIPERRKEEKVEQPEIFKVKADEIAAPKTIGKIDLDAHRKTKKDFRKEKEKEEEKVTSSQNVEQKEAKPVEEKKSGIKIVGKISPEDLQRAKEPTHPVKKQKEKNAEEQPKQEIKEEKKSEKPQVVSSPPVVEENEKKSQDDEPEKLETQYQKLDGPKITGQKIDLTQFQKPKKVNKENSNSEKKKRKRIVKDSKVDVNAVAKSINNNGDKKGGSGQGQNKNFKKGGGNRRPNSGGGNRNVRPAELTDEQVKNQIKETLEKLTSKGGKSKSSKFRRDKRIQRREQEAELHEQERKDNTLKVTEFITVNELASLMNVAATEIISACFSLGVMVTMNQRLDADTMVLVADEFGYKIEFTDSEVDDSAIEEEQDKEEDLVTRAPIVTVMGHVDHGKTSLLDYIRNTNVIAGESGGITQHIGAYNVKLSNGQKITFLDTPGHEAFTAMRARGAQVTDLAIIVVAADDNVMPQTKEAISHAQAAGVPMIFAINKIDKPNSNPDKIKEELSQMNLLVEDWGGNIQSQEISAKFGTNVDILLEKVLLEAEILDLKANPNRLSNGVVIEAALDKGRGYVSTILVQNGTLRVGDYILAGKNHGKVRAMMDERGKPMKEAGPSVPVTVLGLDGAPTAGDKFRVFEDEKEAKQIANKREQLIREQSIRTQKHITLDEIGRRIALGDFKELNIILKGDVDGSVEALTDSLQKLSNDQIQINIIHKGVGQITESDILLAAASDAILIGFNIRPNQSARELAEREEIEIRTYSIIYDVINDVKEAMEGMLSPEIREQIIGNVEIRETFKISKVGTIAGCMVLDGTINRNSKIRIIREGIVVYTGELESLKRFKDDVKEVSKGYECGLNIKNYNDIQIGDLLEVYEEVEVKKKLKI
ncbi:translation initiation factor IF-2 [Apibacter sp. B3706]|uniref:translation initiation factor IF-2 n=1 Tax=unclassified Apibacter TaxID=2630820 RepID=UPI00140D4126|nr:MULTISPECIES: translation initiation factor IF-2 [unclassified Apibacter]QII70820.1 translation initiation factor IF-2 [Apibacter sp. B3706]QYN48152.1 translation initiation factor IF-2 [Apibacter sp. ESL0432]